MKNKYYAIFTPDSDGYTVNFPDLKNCFTEGKDMKEAIEMAEDALNLMLFHAEEKGEKIPASATDKQIKAQAKENDIVLLVSADTEKYKNEVLNRAVRKNVTIPLLLDIKAKENNINLSRLLQKALQQELKIS